MSSPFSFQGHADHPALHSFPTRRSSDLVQRLDERMRGEGLGAEAAAPAGSYHCHSDRNRSEEHTSELQSPYDLVCRLLLEKKKKPEQAHRARVLTPYQALLVVHAERVCI